MKTSDSNALETNVNPNSSPLLATENFQHIFLISHMRANTSLISHILGSHPQISGYYEMHLSYTTAIDLQKQKNLLFKNSDLYEYLYNIPNKNAVSNNTHYLFDKLLHNKYELRLDNLIPEPIAENTSPKIKILISIRPPEQTIKSIINLFSKKEEPHAYADPVNASHYYHQRIEALAQFCERYSGMYNYYDADLIRTDSEKSLKCIQKWLSLDTPLNEQYQVFSRTGQPRSGDSSENMKKGHIVKQQSNYNDIEIPHKLLKKAIEETEHYRQLMINHASDSITF